MDDCKCNAENSSLHHIGSNDPFWMLEEGYKGALRRADSEVSTYIVVKTLKCGRIRCFGTESANVTSQSGTALQRHRRVAMTSISFFGAGFPGFPKKEIKFVFQVSTQAQAVMPRVSYEKFEKFHSSGSRFLLPYQIWRNLPSRRSTTNTAWVGFHREADVEYSESYSTFHTANVYLQS